MVFVRSAIFDMLDIQGDRLVGEETIPIVLGEKRTNRLLVWLVLVLILALLVAPVLGLAAGFSYLMLIVCGYMGLCLFMYRRELMRPGSLRFEALVEGSFYFCGLLAVLYQLVVVGP